MAVTVLRVREWAYLWYVFKLMQSHDEIGQTARFICWNKDQGFLILKAYSNHLCCYTIWVLIVVMVTQPLFALLLSLLANFICPNCCPEKHLSFRKNDRTLDLRSNYYFLAGSGHPCFYKYIDTNIHSFALNCSFRNYHLRLILYLLNTEMAVSCPQCCSENIPLFSKLCWKELIPPHLKSPTASPILSVVWH